MPLQLLSLAFRKVTFLPKLSIEHQFIGMMPSTERGHGIAAERGTISIIGHHQMSDPH